MLGSHNAGSFANQIGWTKFIPKCFSRCQRLNFKQQFDAGVRYFDLRVTYYKGDYYLAHGLVRYNIKLSKALDELSGFNGWCHIGIIIEDTFFKFKGSIDEVHDLAAMNTVVLHSIISKKTNQVYVKKRTDMQINWLIPTAKKWDLHIPEIDCKDINRIFSKKQAIKHDSIMLFDFVETLK